MTEQRTSSRVEIAFLHIGKNAGTQIRHIAQQINQNGNLEIIGFPHHTKLIDLPKDMPYFFSIRNPISRFKSGFYSRKRKGQPRLNIPWTEHEAIAFNTFQHANDLAEALFEPGHFGTKAIEAMQSIVHTSMQQIDWFQRTGSFLEKRPPIAIIRQENFSNDIQLFLHRIGVKNVHISSDPKIAHSNTYQNLPEFSTKAISNLKIWYARDFAFYNMCEAWISHRLEQEN